MDESMTTPERAAELNPRAIAADGGLKPFPRQLGGRTLDEEISPAASDEPMVDPYERPSLEVIEFEKSLEAMSASIISPCAEEARRAGADR